MQKISAQTRIPKETLRVSLHRLGVHMRHELPVYGEPKSVLDSESAILLGLHVGDGWISGRWGLCVHSTDFRMVAEVIRLARRVLRVEPGVTFGKDHVTTVWSAKKQAIEFFNGYGYPAGRKAGIVSVPVQILSASNAIKRSFLRGLFSADGCFYLVGHRGECRFEVSSLNLRNGFVTLAHELGFEFRCYSYIHRGGHNRLPLHTAYLGRQDQVMRWMNEIGSICDSHIERFRRLVNRRR